MSANTYPVVVHSFIQFHFGFSGLTRINRYLLARIPYERKRSKFLFCMIRTSLALQVDSIQSDALFILLVEKDAAFMRLAEDRFYNTYPCIIMTAKGQPDVASRSACPCSCLVC